MKALLSPGNLWVAAAATILFVIVHVSKLSRLYLIVIDEKIPFRRFVFLYCLTTLVNLIVPFKLGEFFRIFVFCLAVRDVKIGFLSVLLDRFFDTVALVLILLPVELLKREPVSDSTLLLTVFAVVAVFVYVAFPSFYLYLNRYLIMNRSSKGAMGSLRLLELVRSGYEYVKRLIHGRYALLVIFSFVAWLMECAILFLLARFILEQDRADVSGYIQNIVSANHTPLMDTYVLFAICLMSAAVILTLFVSLWKKELFVRRAR